MGMQHLLKTAEYTSDVVEVSDELLRSIQTQLLGMMKDIIPVLENNNIGWTLTAGSMLGAVRHEGFIPWDDDLDLVMTRKDYLSFCEVFDKKLADKYSLLKPGDKGYLLHYPQIHKKNTIMQSLQSAEDCKDGLFIDIFILENTYDNSFLRLIHGVLCSALLFIDSTIRMQKCRNNILKYTTNNDEIKKAVEFRAFFARFFAFMPYEKWLALSDKLFSAVNTKTGLGVIPSGAKHYFGEIYEKEVFFPTQLVEFEGIDMRIPINPTKYLSQRYGNDYMKIPEVSKRERHIYIKLDLGIEGQNLEK